VCLGSVASSAVNQMKNRLQALTLLDRAMAAMTDAELEALVASLPDDHRDAIDQVCGAREGGFDDPAARTVALRSTVARGRMNGGLEQIATVLTDQCLADCITALGDHADNPSEEQLLEVTPALVESHGLATVRLMLATSVAGEAAASVMLTRVLKHHDELAVPARDEAEAPIVAPAPTADEETKARRKAAKERKQAEARARREQQARARNRA
jgi:hypothetical protein